MNKRRLFLGGGGDSVSAREIDDLYGKTIGVRANVLYIPVAWEEVSEFDSCFSWFKETYGRFNFRTEMLKDLSKCDIEYLKGFDSIYIGGGNTFTLLKNIKETGFDNLLKEYLDLGGVVYGGSAGAIILGKDISTAALGKCSDLNLVELSNFTGLDLVNDFAIHCHYEKGDYSIVEQLSKEKNLKILALSEESGLFVTGNEVNYIGDVVSFLNS